MKKLVPPLLVLSCIFISPLSSANQEQMKMRQAALQSMDVDGDGMISKGEFLAADSNPQMWEELDKDSDGELDASEQSTTPAPRFRTIY